MEPEAVVDTLIENPAQHRVSFQNNEVPYARLFRGNRRGKSCGTAAYHDNIILLHFPPPHIFSDSISEPSLFLQIFSIGIPVSLERISIVLGVQKPA